MTKPDSLLDDGEPRRLARSVHRRLEDMIFSGQLKSGEVLTERRLADVLEVSRTPLRDALLMLESDGLLRRRGPRYLEVREMTVPEYMQILNIRRLLEPEAARLAIGRIDATVLGSLREELSARLSVTDEDSSDRQSEDSLRIDALVHESIADAAGNPLMAQMIHDLRKRTRIFNLGRMPQRADAVHREHLEIVVALEMGDPHAASEAMLRHIDAVKASIIRHIALV
ncbi:GntR family transcriptional regulator [Mangrovicella endophytica]|uniref:GntR family transcriptional regulator n=1 Tax=Mangrovicella endophytica TaxID=2066697 RepID=UPI000C9E8D65|nr:GntR family transcriptional regulator [Mangrovicella endophytica]